MLHHEEYVYVHRHLLDISYIVLSGPSAGGKTTLSKKIVELFPQVQLLIKHTDRLPRLSEKNNIDYYFSSTEQFNFEIDSKTALVIVKRYEHLYALTLSEVEKCIDNHKIPLFVLDPHAAVKFKEIYKNSILVFVAPIESHLIHKRLIERQEDSFDEIKKRLDYIEEEYELRKFFDINYDCSNDNAFLGSILLKKINERG